MVIVAAYCLYRVLSRRGISIMAGLMGLGILGVGIFPGNHPAPHQVSSLLAFTAGGIAVLLGWRVQAGPLRYLYLALGVVSLLSLVLGLLHRLAARRAPRRGRGGTLGRLPGGAVDGQLRLHPVPHPRTARPARGWGHRLTPPAGTPGPVCRAAIRVAASRTAARSSGG